jgi:D-proline reductase (dithiol) PrdB
MTEEHPMTQHAGPHLTPVNGIVERATRSITGEGRGQSVGQWLGRTFGARDLRRLGTSRGDIPWTSLRRPVSETTVALVNTAGVHFAADHPFDLYSDASFRVIPGWAGPADLQITHRGYDRRDAAHDVNLVFPLPRLQELAAAGVIGRVADEHFGFGLTIHGEELQAPGREVGARMAAAGVDLALLVPA